MFNRDYFRVHTGSEITTDDTGGRWAKRSRYFGSDLENNRIKPAEP